MTRRKTDTRPLQVRIAELQTLISVLGVRKREAESKLLRLEAQAGIVRDQHPVKVTGDGGI